MKQRKPMYAHFTLEIIVPLDVGDPLKLAEKVSAVNDALKNVRQVPLFTGAAFHIACALKKSAKGMDDAKAGSQPGGPELPL